MNIPSINPQLRNIITGAVVDYVFVIHENDIADVECYIDGERNHLEGRKGMSVQDARDWWNKLVHKGYEKVLTP
jgi:hypothetical protein